MRDTEGHAVIVALKSIRKDDEVLFLELMTFHEERLAQLADQWFHMYVREVPRRAASLKGGRQFSLEILLGILVIFFTYHNG
jgi:hypothetical protein